MAKLTIDSTIKLRSGLLLPRLGFGVYQSTAAAASTQAALEAGYRHIDSARAYRNETEVVSTVADFNQAGNSNPIWLTTKVTGQEHATAACEAAVNESVDRAKVGALVWDLFLLHDPTAGPEKRIEAYKVLLAAQKAGKLKAVGVSNFSEVHLQQLVDAGLPLPEVNQIELHPWCQQKPIVQFCIAHDIIVEAYCPLVRGKTLGDETLVKVAKEVGKEPAQVLVRWSLQRGFVPLPKSDTPSRIKSNADVFEFELSEEQMTALDGLDQGASGACSWNPVDRP